MKAAGRRPPQHLRRRRDAAERAGPGRRGSRAAAPRAQPELSFQAQVRAVSVIGTHLTIEGEPYQAHWNRAVMLAAGERPA